MSRIALIYLHLLALTYINSSTANYDPIPTVKIGCTHFLLPIQQCMRSGSTYNRPPVFTFPLHQGPPSQGVGTRRNGEIVSQHPAVLPPRCVRFATSWYALAVGALELAWRFAASPAPDSLHPACVCRPWSTFCDTAANVVASPEGQHSSADVSHSSAHRIVSFCACSSAVPRHPPPTPRVLQVGHASSPAYHADHAEEERVAFSALERLCFENKVAPQLPTLPYNGRSEEKSNPLFLRWSLTDPTSRTVSNFLARTAVTQRTV